MSNEAAARMLETLMEGNRRFVSGTAEHPRQGPARRVEAAGGQRPAAAVVTCSDSRVSPELIFDQGIGDLFVLRSAGNLLDAVGIASIEYAVEHFGVPLVIVMGHSRCGAVAAALEPGEVTGHLSHVVSALRPAIERARKCGGDLADNASRENVRTIVALLRRSEPIMKELVERQKLSIVGAFYDLASGLVTLID